MGIAFVFFFQITGIFVLSVIIALIGGIATFLLSKKENRKKNVLLIIQAPFIAFYTFYFTSLLGTGIISEYKKIDIGFGDIWYVPLSDNYELLFIDSPEQAYIKHEKNTILSKIEEIRQNGNKIYGKTYNNDYFSLDTSLDELKYYSNKEEFNSPFCNNGIALKNTTNFYADRRDEIAGIPLTIVAILSIVASIFSIYITKHIIWKKPDHSIYKPTISHYRRLYRKPPSQ